MIRKYSSAKLILAVVALFIVVAAFLAARGPHISNLLKRLILPEISAATGREVLAQKIYINLFPLFVEARELKVIEKGNEIFYAPRVKGYINISGFFNREIILRRLAVRGPVLRTDAAQLNDIIEKIKGYIRTERGLSLKVVMKSAVIEDGGFDFSVKDGSLKGKGLSGEFVAGLPFGGISKSPALRMNFGLKEMTLAKKDLPVLKASLSAAMLLRDGVVELKNFHSGFYGSSVEGSGKYSEANNSFDIGANLLVKSFRDVFGLKGRGDGEVRAKGLVRFEKGIMTRPVLDLKLKGDMYVQTLLELLKVDVPVEGALTFSGSLAGPLAGLKGHADARLKNGNLFSVTVDDIKCRVAYEDGLLRFSGGEASLYNGKASADATIRVIGENYFTLDIKASDIDSSAVFGLIGWDPGIPAGKVRGEFSSSGIDFDPSGWFDYESPGRGNDVLGRVSRAKGFFIKKGPIISFYDSEAGTDKSSLAFNGDLDISKSGLSLKTVLNTSDIRDITAPYLAEAKGSGEFRGIVTGNFNDPLISGRIRIINAYFSEYNFGRVDADVSYRKNLAEIKDFSAENRMSEASVKGFIRFRDAKELFELRKPEYNLSAAIRDSDLEGFFKLVYKKEFKPRLQGTLNADFRISGTETNPFYEGSARIDKASIGDAKIDSVSMQMSYNYKELVFKNAVFSKNRSGLRAEGRLNEDGHFNFRAEGKEIHVNDLLNLGISGDFSKKLPAELYVNMKTEGRGTLDEPQISGEGSVYGGKYKGIDIGKGSFKISLKDRALVFSSSLFNDNLTFNGNASLVSNMPWKARIEARSGRYDFLTGAFLKDVPDDLLLQLKGYADLSGDKDHVTAVAAISQLNITLYGYSFSNDSDIRLVLQDRSIRFVSLNMRSGATSFSVSGSIALAGGYDLTVEGSSALSPLKGFSNKIAVISGDSRFVFAITGGWDSPKINGGLDIKNGQFGLKDIPYRLSSLNGSVYFDEEKVIIQGLSGKLGGGDAGITGVAYLQRFRLKRFFVDLVLSDISIPVSSGFDLNFEGNLMLKGTPDSRTISGDMKLNRASYRQRVEWKSWLLMARSVEKPKGEAGVFDSTALNIRMHGADNITVDNNVARASLKMDMILRGSLGSPLLSGRIESRTGTVYFRNNEFRILNAVADFVDPRKINPQIEITAETSIRGYNIRMSLDGHPEHFSLSLSSDPPLDDADILALLTVGRLGKEIKGIEGGIGAGEATSFLTGKLQDVLEERVRSLTGMDRLEVDPYVSRTTGSVSPRVTVSKKLLGDKLFVTYSSAVGTTENNVLKLEYLYSRNISLVGVRDEKGSVGGDVKFRFEFK